MVTIQLTWKTEPSRSASAFTAFSGGLNLMWAKPLTFFVKRSTGRFTSVDPRHSQCRHMSNVTVSNSNTGVHRQLYHSPFIHISHPVSFWEHCVD